MEIASTAETNRVITHSLFARYRSDSPLRLRQNSETTTAAVRRVSDTARREGYIRTISAENPSVVDTADTGQRVPAPVSNALDAGGFTRIRNVVSQTGAGRLRAGALFGLTNPLDGAAASFGTALQPPQDSGEVDTAFRTAAAWYRQAGPLRLQQDTLLPSPQVYAQQESVGLTAILTTALSDTSIRVQNISQESSLYADSGTLYSQTPRLLQALFA